MSDEISGPRQYSDDDFDRALRDLTEGTAAEPRFREASAAERARAAKQQAKRSAAQTRRRGRGARADRDRGPARRWTGLGVALVLAAVVAFLWLEIGPQPGAPSGGPSPVNVNAAAPVNPFAGSPAESWANGAAGIAIPAAKPVGNYSAVQVAAAYQTTKRLLIAGDLNQQTLLGGAPAAYADLLTSEQRPQFLGGLNTRGVDKLGQSLSTRTWVVSFAPGSAGLIANVIKVRGTMSAASVDDQGVTALAVTVNYLFVYPLDRPGDPTDWTRFIAHEDGSVDFAPWTDPGGPLQPMDQTSMSFIGGGCGGSDGYQHPAFPDQSAAQAGPQPSGPAVNPYSFATGTSSGQAICSRLSTGT